MKFVHMCQSQFMNDPNYTKRLSDQLERYQSFPWVENMVAYTPLKKVDEVHFEYTAK